MSGVLGLGVAAVVTAVERNLDRLQGPAAAGPRVPVSIGMT